MALHGTTYTAKKISCQNINIAFDFEKVCRNSGQRLDPTTQAPLPTRVMIRPAQAIPPSREAEEEELAEVVEMPIVGLWRVILVSIS
jgi:hypothetical protein